MRLIDADELIERIKTSNDYLGKWDEMNIHDIEVAKTVDAIPTKWLKDRYSSYFRKQFAIGEILRNWEEEKDEYYQTLKKNI